MNLSSQSAPKNRSHWNGIERQRREARGAESSCDAFELLNVTSGLSIVADSKENLHCGREQWDSSKIVMTLLFKRHPNGCHGSSDIAAGELEECEARLALCPAGPGMAEGPLGKVQFALDEIDHAQFVVGDPGVEEIDRLNLGATGERLRSSLVMSAEGPKACAR